MADPEGLLIEGARLATTAARDLWRRVAPPGERDEVPLAHVRPRLELFLAALYGEAPPVLPADPPPAPVWLARLVGRAPRHLRRRTAIASTDGARIWLPRILGAGGGEGRAIATYRLLAVEQAARAARGTPGHVPAPGRGGAGRSERSDPLERDLYLLAEAIAVDRSIVESFPGLAPDLRAARTAALAERPALEFLAPLERAVEDIVRRILRADPATLVSGLPVTTTPSESLAWSRAMALRVRGASGRYRGLAPVSLWGDVTPGVPGATSDVKIGNDDEGAPAPARRRGAALRHRPRARTPGDDEDDERPGTWIVRLDEPMESIEDPMGLNRPADRDDAANADDLADSLSELPEARIVSTPAVPREVLESDAETVARAVATADGRAEGAGIVYPEWDWRMRAYRTRGAVVWPATAPAGSGDWVDHILARHAALVRRVRRRFDGLRPRRVRLSHQTDGADVDLSAYVAAFGDWRAGEPGDDRLYVAERPGRRDLAIMLLIDVSASTDSWVAGRLRIIDVEKEALIVLLEALDALGDRHAILSFSGQGPREVRVLTVKAFQEPVSEAVRRRIAALDSDRYTRAGAAIRHATAVLAGQAVRHRLLLVLSDGKPNDIDEYEGRYGIEDTRQAVAEARLQGLVPFCLTVDREAPAYLRSIFGRGGYALVRRAEHLPAVLVEVVRALLAGS
jgi:nitric oxide reductase NorD protein